MIFCTLFDSNYLDKGLVMYRSLKNVGCDFRMYILAMDEKCREVLKSYNYPEIIVIPLEHFVEAAGLAEVRTTRSAGEFCWTCTSFLIHHVLTEFKEAVCTYVDADLCFYDDPKCLTDEMGEKTVQIVEHRYNRSVSGKITSVNSGKYCVQFNTFKNTPDSLELLDWWKQRCFESCNADPKKSGILGDQGYLESWEYKPNVSVLRHLGGGVAPWNVIQYKLVSSDNKIILEEKSTGKTFPLVFYHYHNIRYFEKNKVNICVSEPWMEDRALIECLYLSYLRDLDKTKNELEKRFGVYPLLKSHPAYQNIKKRTLSDRLRSIDRMFFYKLFERTVISKKNKKYEYLNNISF